MSVPYSTELKEAISNAYKRGYIDRLNGECICPYGYDTMPQPHNLWWEGFDDAYLDSKNNTMQFDCDRLPEHTPRYTYAVAIYHRDGLSYGGGEEGGWWYETGTLERVVKITKSEELAMRVTSRLNHWLSRMSRKNGVRPISASNYSGGQYYATFEPLDASSEFRVPAYYPDRKPHYE